MTGLHRSFSRSLLGADHGYGTAEPGGQWGPCRCLVSYFRDRPGSFISTLVCPSRALKRSFSPQIRAPAPSSRRPVNTPLAGLLDLPRGKGWSPDALLISALPGKKKKKKKTCSGMGEKTLAHELLVTSSIRFNNFQLSATYWSGVDPCSALRLDNSRCSFRPGFSILGFETPRLFQWCKHERILWGWGQGPGLRARSVRGGQQRRLRELLPAW